MGAQDHLQAKASWLPHTAGTNAEDTLPPGFEGLSANQLHAKSSDIPVIKWRCPPRVSHSFTRFSFDHPLMFNFDYGTELLVLQFILDLTWQVVGGEESKEVEVQNQRQMRVLEAVYPRPSAIPPKFETSLFPSPSFVFYWT